MDDRIYKNLCVKVFYFCKIFNMLEKNIMKSASFFVLVFYCTNRRCSQIKPEFKVKNEDRRSLVIYIFMFIR